jgi:hypothetical protein
MNTKAGKAARAFAVATLPVGGSKVTIRTIKDRKVCGSSLDRQAWCRPERG